MRHSYIVLILSVFLTISSATFAAPSSATGSQKINSISVNSTEDLQEELQFNKKAAAFYKEDAAFRKESSKKRLEIFQQMQKLNAQKQDAKDSKSKKNAEDALALLDKEYHTLAQEAALREVKSAEFSLQVAQHRLDYAKKNLAKLQKQQ